mgnify:CR=1 FL=1
MDVLGTEAHVRHHGNACADQRGNGFLLLGDVSFRVDEDIHRIPNGINAQENDYRHHEEDNNALQETPDSEGKHSISGKKFQSADRNPPTEIG